VRVAVIIIVAYPGFPSNCYSDPEYKGQMELYLRWLAKYEREADEALPLGIILCAGASTRQVELLELDAAGIHVAAYLTVFPPREVLQRKLREAIAAARLRFDSKEDV
jgi:hypothetical protein